MTTNQKGFSAFALIIIVAILGIIGLIGYNVYLSSQKADDRSSTGGPVTQTQEEEVKEPAEPTVEVPDNWQEYKNKPFGFSFAYPEDAEIIHADAFGPEVSKEEADYGTIQVMTSGKKQFTFAAEIINDGTIGNADGQGDFVGKLIKSGDVKLLAKSSHELNKSDDNPHIDNDFVGVMKQFDIAEGEAWGFKVNGDFSTDFTVNSGSGFVVDQPTYIVYVHSGDTFIRLQVIEGNETSEMILNTFKTGS